MLNTINGWYSLIFILFISVLVPTVFMTWKRGRRSWVIAFCIIAFLVLQVGTAWLQFLFAPQLAELQLDSIFPKALRIADSPALVEFRQEYCQGMKDSEVLSNCIVRTEQVFRKDHMQYWLNIRHFVASYTTIAAAALVVVVLLILWVIFIVPGENDVAKAEEATKLAEEATKQSQEATKQVTLRQQELTKRRQLELDAIREMIGDKANLNLYLRRITSIDEEGAIVIDEAGSTPTITDV